jgi:hypothetical protein
MEAVVTAFCDQMHNGERQMQPSSVKSCLNRCRMGDKGVVGGGLHASVYGLRALSQRIKQVN